MASAIGRRSVGLRPTSKHPYECDKKIVLFSVYFLRGFEGTVPRKSILGCYFAAYKITLTEVEGNLKIIVWWNRILQMRHY